MTKKEYNQLKRFRIINKKEIFSMAQSDDEHRSILNIARILGMCHFLGIEIDSSCTPLYVLLETYYEHEISEYEQEEPKDLETLLTEALKNLDICMV